MVQLQMAVVGQAMPTPVPVIIHGLPESLRNRDCVEAILEQVGLAEGAIVHCELGCNNYSEAVIVWMASLRMAKRTVEHIGGCRWGSLVLAAELAGAGSQSPQGSMGAGSQSPQGSMGPQTPQGGFQPVANGIGHEAAHTPANNARSTTTTATAYERPTHRRSAKAQQTAANQRPGPAISSGIATSPAAATNACTRSNRLQLPSPLQPPRRCASDSAFYPGKHWRPSAFAWVWQQVRGDMKTFTPPLVLEPPISASANIQQGYKADDVTESYDVTESCSDLCYETDDGF